MNPYATLAALGIVAGSFGAGVYAHKRWADGRAAEAALMASEQARKVERENAVSSIRKLDNFAAEQATNQRNALAARSDLERLQHSLSTIAAAAPAASCPDDPRLAGVVELLRTGSGLVEEGSRHVADLRAKRDALK